MSEYSTHFQCSPQPYAGSLNWQSVIKTFRTSVVAVVAVVVVVKHTVCECDANSHVVFLLLSLQMTAEFWTKTENRRVSSHRPTSPTELGGLNLVAG